jgi:hypothetical protein
MVVGGGWLVDGGDGRGAQTTANEAALDGAGALVCTARGEDEEEEKMDGVCVCVCVRVCGGERDRDVRVEEGGRREEGRRARHARE